MGLVLQLKIGESISIGEIKIKYSTIMPGDQIKLHIEAPKEIKILREGMKQWAGGWKKSVRKRVFIPEDEGGNEK